MNGRFYRIPIAAQAVYEQLRVWIDTALGLPGPRGQTWFPPTTDAPKDSTHIYVHMLEEHYQSELIKPWVDQTISTTWMEPITAEQYFAAVNAIGEQPPPEEWPAWVQPQGGNDAYAQGAKVSHNGKRWVSTTPANVWVPGVFGWEEQSA